MKRKVNKLEKNKYLKKYTCLKGSLKGSNLSPNSWGWTGPDCSHSRTDCHCFQITAV